MKAYKCVVNVPVEVWVESTDTATAYHQLMDAVTADNAINELMDKSGGYGITVLEISNHEEQDDETDDEGPSAA